MKKVSILTLGLLCLSLVACGGGDDANKGGSKSSNSSKKNSAPAKTKKTAADPSAMGPSGGTLDMANAGTVTGTVKFEGSAPAATKFDISRDKWCSANASVMSETLVVANDGGLRDVFVYVDGLDEFGADFPAPDNAIRVTQRGCQYRPHVLGVMVGQDVEIANEDNTSHNYHFTGTANDEINKTQPKPSTNVEVFESAELSAQLRCDIHPWMSANVHIMEHPCFAVSKEDGSFSIGNVPPGKYKLRFVHANAKTARDSIDIMVGAKGTADVGEVTFK